MKRILTFLLAFSMLFTLIPASALAEGDAVSTAAEGECGDNLTWLLQDNGILVISGTGAMSDYSDLLTPWGEAARELAIAIEEIVFEEGVTEISNYAFAWMGELKRVSFSSTVSKIYDSTFVSCMSLQAFEVDEANQYFSTDDSGVLYDKGKTVVMQYPSGNAQRAYTLPATVTEISSRSFTGASNLQSISAESGSTSFAAEDGVLFNYNKTKLVIYPGGKTSTSYTVPDGVVTIGEFAFEESDNITNISFPDTLVAIDHMAFGDCFNLKEVVLPDSVTTVDSQAFAGCISLSDVTLSENLTAIADEMFTCCESLTEITIPDGVTEIGYFAFARCTNLEKAVVPASVITIYDDAFSNCEKLTIYGYAGSYTETYAEENNIPFALIGQSGDDGGSTDDGGTTSPETGYYTLKADYDSTLCSVNMIDPDSSVVITDGKIAYDTTGTATINVVATSVNGAKVKALYVNNVKWTGVMTQGNMDTWFEGVTVTENSTIRIEAERKLNINLSFPETVYLSGTLTLAVDVWGATTRETTAERFAITSTDDTTVSIDLSDNPDTGYYVSFYFMSTNGANTNASVYTTYYYRYSGADNLTKMYSMMQQVYLQNNTDNEISVIVPEGRLLKGKLNMPQDFDIEAQAQMNEVFVWFEDEEGNYVDSAWGGVDSEYNYAVPVPEGLTGTYTASIRPYFIKNSGESEDESATSGGYTPSTNLVIKAYDYVDSDGNTAFFEIPSSGNTQSVDFNFETGYVISGTVEIPEDAVIGEDGLWMSVSGYDADSEEFYEGEGDYYYELSYEEGKTSYSYSFAVSRETKKLIIGAFAHAGSGNIVSGNAYYVSEGEMTMMTDEAAQLEITGDKSGVTLYLLTGAPVTVSFAKPNNEYEYLYYELSLYSASKEKIYSEMYGMGYASPSFTQSLVIPGENEEIYVCYDMNDEYSDTTLYTDTVFVNPDGTYSTSIDSAKPWTVSDETALNIVFATLDDMSSQENLTFNFKVYDNSQATVMLIPIEGATVSITDNVSFSFVGTSDANGSVTASLTKGNTYSISVSKNGYTTYNADFEATEENAEKTTYLPLVAPSTGGGDDTERDVFFTVIDMDTDYPVSGAALTITPVSTESGSAGTETGGVTGATGTATPSVYSEMAEASGSTADVIVITTDTDGTVDTALTDGEYKVVVTKDGYVTKTEEITVSSDEYEFEIEIEKIEIAVDDNTIFYVKDGDLEETPAISGASLTIEDEKGNVITKATDSYGKATADLENGAYYVTAIADGYKTRSFKTERTDTKNSFTVYLTKDDIINVTSTVKELTKDEIEAAGIDTEAIGNKQVYNCTAVLSFMPDVSISYYYTDDGTVVKGGTPTVYKNTSVTPVGRDIYLIVKSTTSWLKEIFEVQIVCDNTSAIETVENLVANLTIPEGLSLAVMTEGEQKENVTLGNIAPKGNTSHKWYICGDEAGEYTLDGTLTGTRTGGGISEDISLTFGIEDSITVLAGDAMTLTIDAETHGTVGEPYLMRYTLENVSDKTLYDLSFSVLGGKFFEDYGVTEAKYAREYGPDAEKDLNGEGFVFETDEFKPGDKIGGLFTITFGEELLLGEGQEWVLKEAFVVTGAGSTTVIPTTINWLYDVPEHNWDEGTVIREATCTEDGEKLFKCKDVSCEETYTQKISATGHNMSTFVTKEPSCEEEGTMTSTCQNEGCTHFVVLPLDELGHSWDSDYTTDKNATCEEAGSKSIHCTRCTATKDSCEIPSLGHSWGDWQTRTDAQCAKDGVKYRVCGRCEDEETGVITQLGHSWDSEYTVDVLPGCETKGSKSKHCSRCEEKTDIQSIPENGHSMGQWAQTKAPDCINSGTKRRDCANCDYYEEEAIPSLGHSWDDGVITIPATEEKEGEKTFTCNVCKETKTETLPVLVKQEVGFTVPSMTYTYGDRITVYNDAYNDSEGGSLLTYKSDNEKTATIDKNGKITITGAGEAVITATAAATDRYSQTEATFTLTVKKAPLTIKANDAEIYYGEEGKNNGFTATGFVLNETDAVLIGTAEYKVNYNKSDKAGEYEITVSGLTADNYDITFTSGKLTVKKATVYDIEFSNLSQRKGKLTEVTASVTPKDDTAKIKIEYQFAEGVWVDTVDSDAQIGEYKVRAYLTESENISVNETPKYFEATLEVKAGAVVNLDGNSDLNIDSTVTGDNVEFTIPDEAVNEIINNVPGTGEIVIDASGSTGGVTNLTLPENIITALDESENVNTFTVIADEAEISMSADVLKTVADNMDEGDKINVHIEAIEKEGLNEEQKAALDAISADAHVLQLNLKVEKADGTTELHELNGKVEVKASYTLPSSMDGKKIVVCYVSDNGAVTYMRATYKDGFVHFTTDHFSHYAIMSIECSHTWDAGTVITQATTVSDGLKRYECIICGETKDETIPKVVYHGGGGGGGGIASYTVKFETNGAEKIDDIKVEQNKTLTAPEAPVKDGYVFEGWYTDKELKTAYDFSKKVTKSFTLYAKWSKEEKTDTSISFKDVKESDWYFENVKYVYENKLMSGVSETEFAPDNTLTRGMLVTILWRMEKEPVVNYLMTFEDVGDEEYYKEAIRWAASQKIVNGVNDVSFAPDDNITREQIAVILLRYANLKGMDALTTEESLSFADSDKISEYAVSAVNWAVSTGLIKGKSDTTVNPLDYATRAEAAALLQRFIEKIK